MLCKHMEQGKGTLVKEFYANLKYRKNLTCYVKGRWVPFGERTLSLWFKLKEEEHCLEFEKLKRVAEHTNDFPCLHQ